MTMQFATFRANFARQMEAYRQRRAELIKAELEKRGKHEHDLARAVGANVRTGERWVSTGAIQRQYRRKVADWLGIPFEDLFPDLVVQEEQIRDQLLQIEAKLDLVLDALGISPSGAAQAAEEAARASELRQAQSAPAPAAKKTRQVSG